MSNKVPENKRLRPRELFFVLLGVVTGASSTVLWFGIVPESMQQRGLDPAALAGLDALVLHPATQGLVLFIGAFVLAAGIATRTASGKDRATWILAGGSVFLFAALLFGLNVVYDPVFIASDPADDGADDDWED